VKLPCGWRISTIGETADTALGKMLDRGRASGLAEVPYLRNVNVQWGRIDTDDVLTMELPDDERDRFQVCAGDLLVCEGGEVGRAAIWSGGSEYMAYQKALHRLRPRTGVDAKFLRYLLEHHAGNGTLAKHSTGSTIAHLPQQRLREIEVPLPKYEEQRRIVDILEDHLSRLDAAACYLDTALQRTQRWAAGMADLLIWGPRSPSRELGTLLREPMRNGRSDRAATGTNPGIRALTLTAVTRNEFTDANTKLTTTSSTVARGLWLEPGDIFVQRANTPDLVGTSARFDGPEDWAIFPDLLIRVRPDESMVDSRFMVAVLRSERSHRALRARAKGLAGSMPKIDQAAVAA